MTRRTRRILWTVAWGLSPAAVVVFFALAEHLLGEASVPAFATALVCAIFAIAAWTYPGWEDDR